MLNFKKVKEGNTSVIGLNNELESIYINNIYNTNTSNVLVVVNSIYEANKMYNSIINYNKNVSLFLMDDFIASEASIMSPELEISRLETLNSIVFDNNKKIIVTNLMGLLRF